jgi:putative membrane protein
MHCVSGAWGFNFCVKGKEGAMWHHMNEYGWGWGGMMLGMLLFWAVLVAAIVMLMKYALGRGDAGRREREKTALDILKERYARGEIEREEFEQKKHDLES